MWNWFSTLKSPIHKIPHIHHIMVHMAWTSFVILGGTNKQTTLKTIKFIVKTHRITFIWKTNIGSKVKVKAKLKVFNSCIVKWTILHHDQGALWFPPQTQIGFEHQLQSSGQFIFMTEHPYVVSFCWNPVIMTMSLKIFNYFLLLI